MRSLRALIDHPQYDLVDVYVYSDAKAGRDAGELRGTGQTGVVATKIRRRDHRGQARLREAHC
jgi:hypothetical protein